MNNSCTRDRECVCLLLQDLVQSCLRVWGGILEDMCYGRRRAAYGVPLILMIPHLTEDVQGGLNSGQKRDLQINHIHLVRVVKDLELVLVVKSVAKGLSDVLLHKSP